MRQIKIIICFLLILLINYIFINFHLKHTLKKDSWKHIRIKPIKIKCPVKNRFYKKILQRKITLNKYKRKTFTKLTYLNTKYFPFKYKYDISNQTNIPSSNILLTTKKRKYFNIISSNINKFLEFQGSRTTIIQFSKNTSLIDSSKTFNREDYLNLHINGKDKFQNIKADIIENNFLNNLGNKTKIEASFNNINLSLGENKVSFNENDILLENKTLKGLDLKSKYNKFYLRLISGQINTDKIEEEIYGNGTEGPYSLNIKHIFPNSEELKLNNKKLTRDIDYIIDYEAGILKFINKYIKNSEKLYLTYEAENNINKNILGFESNYTPSPYIECGFDYLKQFKPAISSAYKNELLNFNTYGFRFNCNKSDNLKINSYFSLQKSSGFNRNITKASKLHILFKKNNFLFNANYKNSGKGFNSLGNMELYPYSKQYEVNLLLKNRFFGIDNELKNINIHLPSNLSSKRHVNSKLNLLSNHFFGLSYNFLHDEELFNDENIKNISKANHAVIFNLNKSPINWETSITNSKIYQSNNIEYSTISKSSLNFNTKISLLNIIFENTRKNNAFESREYGVSFELRPFKSFFIKTDYNKYLYKEENNSDSLRLDWRLNAPFINSYCSLNLKTISDNILDKNKEISGIMKFNLIPSQTISLDFAYIPQITKNQNNKILKDYSSNQINFLLSNSNDFLLELKSQKNNYFSDLNTNSVLTNYTNNSYFLRSNIKFNNLLSLDNHFSCDIKKYNFNTNKNYGFVLNTCMQFNKNKFLNCGYEYQNDNLSLKNGFTMSFSYNNSKTFKFLTLLKFFSSKDFINPDKRSSSVEPSFETTINPKSNLELNFHYNYSKEISNSSSSKNSIDASINYHINKHFEFKLNASYYKNTNPHIKNINIESIFTTTFQ